MDSSANENLIQFNILWHKVFIHLKKDRNTLVSIVKLQPMPKAEKDKI